MHRSITTLQQAGLPIEPFPQTQPNLTLATETLYSALNNQRLRLYDAPDLRQHVLNAASVETSRGFRLAKEKQSLKIDGAVALSLCKEIMGVVIANPVKNIRPIHGLCMGCGYGFRWTIMQPSGSKLQHFRSRRRSWCSLR